VTQLRSLRVLPESIVRFMRRDESRRARPASAPGSWSNRPHAVAHSGQRNVASFGWSAHTVTRRAFVSSSTRETVSPEDDDKARCPSRPQATPTPHPKTGRAKKKKGPAPMERRNHGSFDASKGLQWMGDGGVGIVDGVVASLFLS
jgi:hypothetical protein